MHSITGAPIDRSGCPARPDAKGRPRHGNRNAYKENGCRCPDAREGHRIYQKRLREGRNNTPGRSPSLGTTRRLQALRRIGYSITLLAVELQLERSLVGHLRRGRYRTTFATHAPRIAVAYDRLSGRPVWGAVADRTRRDAAAKGWASPLAWEGLDIDNPHAEPDYGEPDLPDAATWRDALNGDLPTLRPGMGRCRPSVLREAAVCYLTETGLSVGEIALLFGVEDRTIERHRAATRIAGWRFSGDDMIVRETPNPGLQSPRNRARRVRREQTAVAA